MVLLRYKDTVSKVHVNHIKLGEFYLDIRPEVNANFILEKKLS